MPKTHITSVSTIAELKKNPGKDKNPVLILGNLSVGDGGAAHYYWDDVSVEAEDPIYFNTIAVTGVSTGRWKKVIARIVNVPQGRLVYNGGKKELFVDTVVASDGNATINLTMDNTTNGTPIFSQIWFDDSKATVNTTAPEDAVSSCRKELKNGNKQLTHLFFRGNSTVLGASLGQVLSANIKSQRTALTGTPVTFKIEGI